MWFFGRNRGEILLRKVKALHTLGPAREHLGQFYTFLTVLDAKATGLLTADAVLVAILVGFLGLQDVLKTLLHQPDEKRLQHVRFVLEIQVSLIAVSALMCLLVVSIGWSMLAKMHATATHQDHCAEELRWLANVVDDRTHYYWIAWALTLAAFVLTVAWWSWCYAALAAMVIIAWTLGRR